MSKTNTGFITIKQLLAFAIIALFGAGCTSTGTPSGIEPIQSFELPRYLGKWYEIARLDHSFEENLQKVTAEYSMRDDGGVMVLNRGFNVKDNDWEKAEGRAYFVGEPNVGHLKVSFFGPFYSSYVIFELGEDYDYAFVSGPDREYLWLLAREPKVAPELYQRFVARAQELGFATGELIKVNHDMQP